MARKKKTPKCLVIDADVARAAGEASSQDAKSKSCRAFLACMLDETQHKVVLTKDIQAEWNKHQSRVTQLWRRTMIAQKRVCLIEVATDTALRQQIEKCAPSVNKSKAMLKDVHLAEAACQADKIVISMDEVVRGCFHEIAHFAPQLKQLTWINPQQDTEKPLLWLRNGAECESTRCLGYGQRSDGQ